MVFLQLAFSLQSARACLARIKRALDHNQDLPEMLRQVGSLRHTWRQNLRNILESKVFKLLLKYPKKGYGLTHMLLTHICQDYRLFA